MSLVERNEIFEQNINLKEIEELEEGPWKDAPHFLRFEYKGFRCYAVKFHGHWNGYVILPYSHRFYRKNYNDIHVNVHGGLTFSNYESARIFSMRFPNFFRGFGYKYGRLSWLKNKEKWVLLKQLRFRLALFLAFKHCLAFTIPIISFLGKRKREWTIGFDCAHLGDFYPMSKEMRVHIPIWRNDVYRDKNFVEQEIKNLVDQL